MLILRNGGSALDAAEMAVKILEDREITNAGYGSNLAMDGVVECDASIVDHYGRSGAVGAVYRKLFDHEKKQRLMAAKEIRNPVSLARLVLNHTTQSLTLRRVPPNLLVAQGALQFAREMGVPELPHDALVSEAAKERWIRWHGDLKIAERKARKAGQHPSCWKLGEPMTPEDEVEHERLRKEHTKNLIQGFSLWSGSDSPTKFEQSRYYTVDDELATNPSDPSGPNSDYSILSSGTDERIATPESTISDHLHNHMPARQASIKEASGSAFINSTQKVPTMSQFKELKGRNVSTGLIAQDGLMADVNRGGFHARRSWADGSGEDSESTASGTTTMSPGNTPQGTARLNGAEHTQNIKLTPTASIPLHSRFDQEDDHITDTVGAIAVDGWGNIACAASSGGIGMKYRGRIGPAALVGVGTAVIPRDPDDSDETCVATVTSGTGEHMATTMAATVCAERLYQSVKKQKGGEYVEVTEDEALRSMIENEFMGKESSCQAIDWLLNFHRTSECQEQQLSRCHWNSWCKKIPPRSHALLRSQYRFFRNGVDACRRGRSLVYHVSQ